MRIGSVIVIFAVLLLTLAAAAQSSVKEQSFSLPASTLQAMLKKLPGGTSGTLPVLDGFVVPGAHALDHYHRPYYECSVRIAPVSSTQSLIRVTAKITAWNDDAKQSGYEVLESNGRIESDLLGRLQQLVDSESRKNGVPSQTAKQTASNNSKVEPAPQISAPVRQLPSLHDVYPPKNLTPTVTDSALEQEAKNLEEILRNQSHPANLVAVKVEHTAVLQTPRTDGTVLFLADAEDEFEVLDENASWVYVRVSGLSRGWIRRSNVEPVDGSTGTGEQTAVSVTPKQSALFTVSSEEIGNFPGQWTPLKGKSVRIISVQPTPGTGHATSAEQKLQFAEAQFKQTALQASLSTAGVVLIFDSEDGGMVAATLASLEQWKNGALSDQAFWTQCYFDPPEIFGSANR